ncbi:MAG: hypothetical protein IJU95_02605 [Treponema sp.]|nr:hypothetical protein [Treponema sp.]
MMTLLKKLAVVTICGLVCLAGLSAATMDARVNAVPKSLMEKVFTEPEETLPSVVASLTSGMSGTAAKVKVLHDWICNNIAYDTIIFTDRWQEASNQDYVTVLKKKKAVCSGYTNLMSQMCRHAGKEAVGKSGRSKGFAYEGNVDGQTNHAWNAVKIGNKWQLLDVTWDAGYCDWGYFVKHYSTEWLYRTPREFLYSHLPKEEEYQFFTPIVTKEQFVREPYVPGVFFYKGFSLIKDKSPLYTNLMTEARKFEIGCSKSSMLILTQFYPREGSRGRYLNNAIWVDRSGNRVTVDADVPDARTYRLAISCRDPAVAVRQDYYSSSEMEQEMLPGAERLLAAKKITQRELDLFKESFEQAGGYHRYYFLEDQFATERNRAVEKVLKLLDVPADYYDDVLYFDLKADEGYTGFGDDVARFPRVFVPFTQYGRTTRIISPQGGMLKKGSEQHFCVKSNDFVAFCLYIDEENIRMFNKNPKTGEFELDFIIPDGMKEVEVMGSRDGKRLDGLWYYLVE